MKSFERYNKNAQEVIDTLGLLSLNVVKDIKTPIPVAMGKTTQLFTEGTSFRIKERTMLKIKKLN